MYEQKMTSMNGIETAKVIPLNSNPTRIFKLNLRFSSMNFTMSTFLIRMFSGLGMNWGYESRTRFKYPIPADKFNLRSEKYLFLSVPPNSQS